MQQVRRNIDEELDHLQSMLLKMADTVDAQFANALNAVFRSDLELAKEVMKGDDTVDRMELEIDHHCERVLALHHPVADELRLLISAIKINTDLERIGDHCKNIARNVPHVKEVPAALEATRLREMGDASREMLREVYDAYLNLDRPRAEAVLARDERVNDLHRENFHLLVEHGRQNPDHLEAVAHLLTTGKAMERISDHAKNIAERVIFVIEGIDVRHRNLRNRANRGSS